MNRETEVYFSELPVTEAKRSSFLQEHSHKTTFSTGQIIPIFVDGDILPGDTVEMDVAEVVRGATPIFPVMDNAYLDIMFFFVPHRLVWEHWTAFWGENNVTYWEQPTDYEIPQVEAPSGGWTEGTLADYFGIPTKIGNISVSALQGRAYCKIFNDWFRDENLMQPCMINTDETTLTGVNTGDPITDAQKLGLPLMACKAHDLFTASLPEPQKGPAVQIPLGTSAPIGIKSTATNWFRSHPDQVPVNLVNPTAITANSRGSVQIQNESPGGATLPADNYLKLDLNNLYADLNNATASTINALRTAWAIQEFYERQASGGSRYIEFLSNIFGVKSSDARLQRAEYVGGTRIPINIDQVLQTSSTDAVSPQGNTGAFSATMGSDSLFTKSFEEHGTLMGLAIVRTEHTYQQGIPKQFLRKKWHDFYVPQFAELGELPIKNSELYAQGSTVLNPNTGAAYDEEVFGYQEAWADYRYKLNRVSGLMRSNATGSLDAWHYADDYSQLPTLGSTWIRETDQNVARTMAVQNEPQWIADFFFKAKYVRPMPIYSRPFGMQYM